MAEDVPALGLSTQEFYQWSQGAAVVWAKLQRTLIKLRIETGRLAFSDDEHAARLADSWDWPPVRLMTDVERLAWRARVPAALSGLPVGDEPVVCVARLDPAGDPVGAAAGVAVDRTVDGAVGEWGVEAHLRDADGAVESVFLVCRDPSDAVAVAAGLRREGTAEQVRRLRALATGAAASVAGPGGAGSLDEQRWVAALREALPTRVADMLIPAGPGFRHAASWRELLRLASGEVARVGADPRVLAGLIAMVPRWHDGVRNPAALAHWALTQARAQPGYEAAVAPAATGPAATTASTLDAVSADVGRVRTVTTLNQPVGPIHAISWAMALDTTNAEHQLAAKVEFGRWGSAVDRALAARFPGLVTSASAAARRSADHGRDVTNHRPAASAAAPVRPVANSFVDSPGDSAAQAEDALTRAELIEQVQRMDPARPVDRRAAHVMLGRVPLEVDRLLVAKFGADPAFAAKLATVHPHGLPAESTPTSEAAPADPRAAHSHRPPAAAAASTSTSTASAPPHVTVRRGVPPEHRTPHRRP